MEERNDVARREAAFPNSSLARLTLSQHVSIILAAMEPLLSVLRINDTIVYSVYGQVFFCLGLVVAFSSRRHSQLDLARQIVWLAAFGLSHGMYEWAYVFIPIQATYLPKEAVDLLSAARAVLLPLSFFFLGQFGCLVALPDGRPRQAARAAFAALLAFWFAWALLGADILDAHAFPGSAWARRLIGLPASAIAAVGMFRQARIVSSSGLRSIARDFRIAGTSFAAYAFLAGFVVGPVPDPQGAQWPAYSLALQLFGLPAPVLRSLAGLGMAFGIVRGLRIFDVEMDRLLEAVERERLKAAERARSAMESMAATISSHGDLHRLLPAALEQAIHLAGARAGWLTLAGSPLGSFEIMASTGFKPLTRASEACLALECCPCRAAALLHGAATFPPDTRCAVWLPNGAESTWAAIPLSAHGRVVGVTHLLGDPFTPELLDLLTSIGRQLGLAVENAELAREVERKEAARAQLLRKAITAQEEERRRVARELHDQTGQSLAVVIMTLGAAGERLEHGPKKVSTMVENARQIAVQALESTREMIVGLRPAALDDLGLLPALRRFTEDLERNSHISMSIHANDLTQRLPPDVEVVMFRILQESLHNVVRHAGARRALVRLACSAGVVEAEVSDDGSGFDLAEATAHPETGRGLGLLGMTERAGLLGGRVSVETAPGQGTRVLVNIPLAAPVGGP